MEGCMGGGRRVHGRGEACLQEVMLDSIHNDLLHLTKAHEGHQVSQSRDLHHAVHMAQLLQQAQHSHPLQGLAVLLQGHLVYWAGACKQADSRFSSDAGTACQYGKYQPARMCVMPVDTVVDSDAVAVCCYGTRDVTAKLLLPDGVARTIQPCCAACCGL